MKNKIGSPKVLSLIFACLCFALAAPRAMAQSAVYSTPIRFLPNYDPANPYIALTAGPTQTGDFLDIFAANGTKIFYIDVNGVPSGSIGTTVPWSAITDSASGTTNTILMNTSHSLLTWTNPAANATAFNLAMGTATGTSKLLNLADGASNTGTGCLLCVNGGAGSAAQMASFVAPANANSTGAVSIIDTTGSTATGGLLNVHTVGTSTDPVLLATAQGTANGVEEDDTGLLAPIGSGNIKASVSTAPTDGFYVLSPGSCGMTLTTGALAAASTTGPNVGLNYAAANNAVLQVSTSAAASAMTLDCDITPPSRTTSGKGVTITSVQVLYGYQGADALSTIAGPTIATVTYSTSGGAAAGTVAAAGGSITVTAGTSHSSPGAATTTGQCYSEHAAFGTPKAVTNGLQRVTLEEVFNHTAASAATYQVCGVVVYYTNQIL